MLQGATSVSTAVSMLSRRPPSFRIATVHATGLAAQQQSGKALDEIRCRGVAGAIQGARKGEGILYEATPTAATRERTRAVRRENVSNEASSPARGERAYETNEVRREGARESSGRSARKGVLWHLRGHTCEARQEESRKESGEKPLWRRAERRAER